MKQVPACHFITCATVLLLNLSPSASQMIPRRLEYGAHGFVGLQSRVDCNQLEGGQDIRVLTVPLPSPRPKSIGQYSRTQTVIHRNLIQDEALESEYPI